MTPREEFRQRLAEIFRSSPDFEDALFRWAAHTGALSRRVADPVLILRVFDPASRPPVIVRSCLYRGGAYNYSPSFEAPSPFSGPPLQSLRQQAEFRETADYQAYVENEDSFEWAALAPLWSDLPLRWLLAEDPKRDLRALVLHPDQPFGVLISWNRCTVIWDEGEDVAEFLLARTQAWPFDRAVGTLQARNQPMRPFVLEREPRRLTLGNFSRGAGVDRRQQLLSGPEQAELEAEARWLAAGLPEAAAEPAPARFPAVTNILPNQAGFFNFGLGPYVAPFSFYLAPPPGTAGGVPLSVQPGDQVAVLSVIGAEDIAPITIRTEDELIFSAFSTDEEVRDFIAAIAERFGIPQDFLKLQIDLDRGAQNTYRTAKNGA